MAWPLAKHADFHTNALNTHFEDYIIPAINVVWNAHLLRKSLRHSPLQQVYEDIADISLCTHTCNVFRFNFFSLINK